MKDDQRKLRVLHSFPLRLGKGGVCTTAWYEIDGAAAAGAEMLVMAGDSVKPFPHPVRVRTTLFLGKVPYQMFGVRRACALHDWLVARKLPELAAQVDIIHAWPMGALETTKVARRLGIPVALERCNAHTRFAYEVVQKEYDRIGVTLPPDHGHAFNAEVLRREEEEYAQADGILCPSDFVMKTFLDQGFAKERLVRFFYGVDEELFYPDLTRLPQDHDGLTMIFAGVDAVRKGLHYALEAWLQSPASVQGTFLIAGDFLPEYRKKLAPLLTHPSIQVLGHSKDIPELMRKSDLFVLPSIEEGFGLVCTEAMASGCVPLVSDACTDLCVHMENSLVHKVGDTRSLSQHITMLHRDRSLLRRLRDVGLQRIPEINWNAAGRSLLNAYNDILGRSKVCTT